MSGIQYNLYIHIIYKIHNMNLICIDKIDNFHFPRALTFIPLAPPHPNTKPILLRLMRINSFWFENYTDGWILYTLLMIPYAYKLSITIICVLYCIPKKPFPYMAALNENLHIGLRYLSLDLYN